MPKATSWMCNYCGTIYGDERSAEACEDTHMVLLTYDLIYVKHERIPSTIHVEFLQRDSIDATPVVRYYKLVEESNE